MGVGKIFILAVWFVLLSFTAEAEGNRNPVFDEVLSYANVLEEEVGFFVGTIRASDEDGDNLTYGIQETAPQYLDGNKFDSDAKLYLVVDPISGNVTVQNPVDRESTTKLRPTWTVSDGKQLVTAVEYLIVIDKNDVIPRFQGLQDRLNPVLETTAVNESIISFSVLDEDEGDNGLVNVTFATDDMDCDEIHPFEIQTHQEENNNFDIIVAEELDYSVKSQYILCLVAEDNAGGNDSLKSNISKISIPIEDVQDKPPVFLQLPYNTEIYENNEVGSHVITVTAQDGDRGVLMPNAVEFTLNSPYFQIDSYGTITAKESLDRESLDENPFRLNVTATEVDDTQPIEQRESEVNVVITVLDEDDNIPEFSVTTTVHADLFENSPEGTRLNLGVTVTDADEPKNAAFELILKQSLDVFDLVPVSGQGSALVDVRVINSTLIDYEIRQQMNFTIIAYSPLGNESSLEVTVNIINLNDNDPVFSQDGGYQGDFTEDVSPGYSILTVQATDEDIGAVVSYKINPPVKEFEVEPSSGVITTTSEADFNALLRPEYVFSVEASDGERVQQTLVTLSCIDVNDNAPVFQRHFEEIFWTEFQDEIPDIAIIRLAAFDADPTSPNNQFSYFITDGDPEGKFWINDTSGEIFFGGSVDYDIGDKAYFLTISAIDHGSPPMEGNTTLNVTILDENDNPPIFEEDLYTFSVKEDVLFEYVVGTVTATDEDSGNNRIIDYNIIDGSRGVFYITNKDNVGSIRVGGGGLDKETAPENGYSLNVSAQDRGSPPLFTSCLVNITVLDVNDEKPVFDPDQELKYSVPEDASPGFLVLTLHATDLDGDNKLSYHIEKVTAEDETGDEVMADFSNQFTCDEDDGTISVNEPLNREIVETFFLEVVVNDTNAETKEQQTDTATVTITILDLNDNAPVFETITEELTVIEGSANGTIVTTEIRATDADKGSNGEVVYSLEDDAGGAFRIERRTGNLRVHNDALVDREMYEMLTITVRATDMGSPSKFTEKEVNIQIEDINDNTPVFEENPYTGTVFENSAIDTFICKVTAVDMDATFGVLTYTIVGGNTDEWFEINSTTGDISVADNGIDREKVGEVTLVVVADDPGEKRDTTEVIITIEDENDKWPVFTYFENITIPEDISKDTVVTTVVATDEDKPNTPASTIEYSILEGNGTAYFDIGKESGEVFTIDSLDDNNPSKSRIYEIIIQAEDKADPFNSVAETMFIIVDDAGNNAPVITYPEDHSFLPMAEHYDNKLMPVVTATAVDSDAGDDSKIAFRLVERTDYDSSLFRVNNFTGDIFYEGEPLDWFVKPQFRLYLEAYNYLSASDVSDSVDFFFNVTDVDNHDPAFPTAEVNQTATAEMKVPEKKEGGTMVGSVSATDKDDGNPIFYFIIDGNKEGYFRIDKYTGVIFTTEELDGSTISSTSYLLTIKSTENETYGEDSATRKKRQMLPEYDPTIIMVTINIVDLNDNPPYFPEELYTAGVVYTTDFDVIVTRISAEDEDPDENNRNMTYSILSQVRLNTEKEVIKPDDTAFYIDPKTGDIYTKASFLGLGGGVYFQMVIEVVDPDRNRADKFFDQTELLIYVIIESQQLNIYTSVSADESRAFEVELSKTLNTILSSYTGGSYDTHFDRISSHIDSNGNSNARNESDALFHVVNLTDSANEIVPAPDVLHILDHSPTYVDEMREEFSVKIINLAAYTPEEPAFTSFQFAVVILAGIFFIFLILAIMAFFFYQNQNQKTLKAYGVVIENDYQLPNDEPLTKTANPVFENPGYDEDDYECVGSETSTIEKVMTIDDEEEEPPVDENTTNSKLLENLLLNQQILDDASSDLHISDV